MFKERDNRKQGSQLMPFCGTAWSCNSGGDGECSESGYAWNRKEQNL